VQANSFPNGVTQSEQQVKAKIRPLEKSFARSDLDNLTHPLKSNTIIWNWLKDDLDKIRIALS